MQYGKIKKITFGNYNKFECDSNWVQSSDTGGTKRFLVPGWTSSDDPKNCHYTSSKASEVGAALSGYGLAVGRASTELWIWGGWSASIIPLIPPIGCIVKDGSKSEDGKSFFCTLDLREDKNMAPHDDNTPNQEAFYYNGGVSAASSLLGGIIGVGANLLINAGVKDLYVRSIQIGLVGACVSSAVENECLYSSIGTET